MRKGCRLWQPFLHLINFDRFVKTEISHAIYKFSHILDEY